MTPPTPSKEQDCHKCTKFPSCNKLIRLKRYVTCEYYDAQEVSKGARQGLGSVKKDDTEGNPKPLWSSGKMQTEMDSEWSSSKEPLETSHKEEILYWIDVLKICDETHTDLNYKDCRDVSKILSSSIPRSEVEKLRDEIEKRKIEIENIKDLTDGSEYALVDRVMRNAGYFEINQLLKIIDKLLKERK